MERYSPALIGIKGRADAVAGLAAHAAVLAFGLVLVAPVILARHSPADLTALAWSARAHPAAARNPMAFEQASPAQAEEGPTGSVEWVPAPVLAATSAVSTRPTFAPPPEGTGGIGVQAIYSVFGRSPGLTWALRVARCESHYNPLAVNAQSGASGLFQFMPSTWNAHFTGWNIWDPYAQARAALVFYNEGATDAWTCK